MLQALTSLLNPVLQDQRYMNAMTGLMTILHFDILESSAQYLRMIDVVELVMLLVKKLYKFFLSWPRYDVERTS
jgi:hypothetical protein